MQSILPGNGWTPGPVVLFKWTDAQAAYEPWEPWPSIARFSMGSFLALYVAETAAGAMAEFFRRRPELLGFQDELRIRLFSIAFDINSECLDVRDDVGQASAGIALERLTSSDEDEGLRYAACRDLAQDAVDASVVGIAYPSAAAAWASAWNLVLFGDPAVATWTVTSFSETVIPRLRPTDVKVL